MKKFLSTLLTLAMLVPTFGAFPALAAGSENDASAEAETQYVAAVYDANGELIGNSNSVSRAMLDIPHVGGTVKLLADSEEDTPVHVIGGNSTTLDLNGHKIKRDRKNNMSDPIGNVISLGESADLTIIDSSNDKNGTIEGGGAKWGGGIYAPKDNVVTMNAGTIINCTAYYGGGVYVDESSKFIMNGGKIDHCYAKYGGGVYVEDKATFETHYNSQITNNIAEKDGGGIYVWSAFANLDNCYIGHNRADYGGGIYSDYNSSKMQSYITISGSTIEGNKSQKGYGGIYHNDGRLILKDGTKVIANYTNGTDGGGVYSEKCSIELGGDIEIYGNTANSYEPCDVSFGKSLDSAFKLLYALSSSSFIGVNSKHHKPKAWYDDMHISYYHECNIDSDLPKVDPLKDALFSNNLSTGFTDTFDAITEDYSSTVKQRHYLKIIESGDAVNDKIKATTVTYKNIPLPQSDFSSSYDPARRTIFLNVPKYVKEYRSLSVMTDNPNVNFYQGSHLATSSGWGDKVYTRYGLVIQNVNDSPSYTVSVEGGTIDGIAPDENGISSTKKEFFDELNIEPIVPDGMMFSRWEVSGDYTTDYIIGYNQYTKIPLGMLMPNGNVTFKAVFKPKVTSVKVDMFSPEVGARTPFYTKDLDHECLKATVTYYKEDGTVLSTEQKDVTWKKRQEMFDGTAIHYFDYYANYLASLQFQDTQDGDFCLADRGDLKVSLTMDGIAVGKSAYDARYDYAYGDGYRWQQKNDNNPIRQRILYITRYYTSEKAPIRKSIPTQIRVPLGTTKKELTDLLPESVNVQIADISYSNGTEQAEITHSPVVWNTDNLPDTVTGRFEIKGTYNTENKGFELKGNENIYPTLIVVPDTQELSEMPQVTVDGTPVTAIGDTAKIALNKKIKLVTSMANADIHYKLDGGELTKYTPDAEIELSGAKDAVTAHEIEAYAEADGKRSETLKLTIEVDNKTKYTVNIVDPNNKAYRYCEGVGEYKLGETVSVNLHKKFMKNPFTIAQKEEDVYDPHKRAITWSAKGIVLNSTQKENPIFTFDMPNSNVIIKLETFKYLDTTHTVTVVDQDGNPYEYVMGAGEYKEGDTVTIDSSQFTLKSVNSEGAEKIEENATKDDEVVSQWSAEGVELTDEQKKSSKFKFTMPYNDVTIKAEAFRPLVKKVYLSSITPVAGKALPDKLEILSATDVNGNEIDKDEIMLKTEIPNLQGGMWTIKGGEDDGKMVSPGTIAEIGKTYVTFFSVQQISENKKATVDDYEIYMDGEKVELDLLQMFTVQTEAIKDELLEVDWGADVDGAAFYDIETAIDSLPKKVKVKTKYGTIGDNMVDVEWSKTEQLMNNKNLGMGAAGNYHPVATLKLPDYVDAANEIKTKEFTVKVRNLVKNIRFTPLTGSIPAKAGETFPTYVKTNDLDLTGFPEFHVLSEDNADVTGKVAEAGKKYTVKIKVRTTNAQNEFSKNTQFTINGNAMDIISVTKSDSSYGDIYELSYTFTAEETKEYDVVVNGTSIGQKQNGDTVSISTDNTTNFYNWTAEAVYDTIEDVVDEKGNVTGKTTVTHRNDVSLFDNGDEYKANTSFTMPQLIDDNAKLVITANYAHGITDYNPQTKTAEIVSDKSYQDATVIFASYCQGKLISVQSVNNTNLASGINSITAPAFVTSVVEPINKDDLNEGDNSETAPEKFRTINADTVKVMVWNNLNNMTPLFESLEKPLDVTEALAAEK